MFSPVKTLAGAALATVIAGSLFIAQPLHSEPAADPPAAELEPAAAAVVTGTIIASTSPADTQGNHDVSAGVIRTDGIHHTNTWETSDPRLSGTATYDAEWIRFPPDDFQVESAVHVLENAEGRWVGSGSALSKSNLTNTDIAIMSGEGAYEGLTAYVLMDWTAHPPTIEAAIFPGEMPVVSAPLGE